MRILGIDLKRDLDAITLGAVLFAVLLIIPKVGIVVGNGLMSVKNMIFPEKVTGQGGGTSA